MPDTHVPLDEAEFIKWAYYNKEASLTGTQAREVWKYISNLKHTIVKEVIEDIRLDTVPDENVLAETDESRLVRQYVNMKLEHLITKLEEAYL